MGHEMASRSGVMFGEFRSWCSARPIVTGLHWCHQFALCRIWLHWLRWVHWFALTAVQHTLTIRISQIAKSKIQHIQFTHPATHTIHKSLKPSIPHHPEFPNCGASIIPHNLSCNTSRTAGAFKLSAANSNINNYQCHV